MLSSYNSFYIVYRNVIIFSSDRLVDEQINIAINMKENLQSQHFSLRDISRKLNTMTSM